MLARISIGECLDEPLRQQWLSFSSVAKHTPYQTLDWYEAWLTTVGVARRETPVIVQGFDDQDRLRILLPLVAKRHYGVTIAAFPGDKHANFNFPLTCPDTTFSQASISSLLAHVAQERSIDLFFLDALPSQWDGTANPLLSLPHRTHPAPAYILDFDLHDFDASDAVSVGRKARKARHAERALAKAGVCLRRAADTDDIAQSLRAFLTQKRRWFSKRGIPDSFSEPGIADFLLALFSRPQGNAELHLLRIGDVDVALAGLLTHSRHASLMFTSYDDASPHAGKGPGKRLLRFLGQELQRRSFRCFDFGLGDAPHKPEIGAVSQNVYVVSRPTAPAGHVMAFAKEAERIGKRYVKQSPRLLAASRAVQVRLRAMTK